MLPTDAIDIVVSHGDETVCHQVPVGTTLESLSTQIGATCGALHALVDHHPRRLTTRLYEPCQVTFVGYDSAAGRETYLNTLILLLSHAAHKLQIGDLTIAHAIGTGYYLLPTDPALLQTEHVDRLRAEVDALIAADLELATVRLPLEQAISYFGSIGCPDTVALLHSYGRCYVEVTKIEERYAYLHGMVLPRTSALSPAVAAHAPSAPLFALEPYHCGLLLRLPHALTTVAYAATEGHHTPQSIAPAPQMPKLQAVFEEQRALSQVLGVASVGLLNSAIRQGRSSELITIAEAMQERSIARIASTIAERHLHEGLKVVLIAGPSSSGKTTTGKRLRTQLITHLLRPHLISLDDFYVNRVDTPLTPAGTYDYESLYALDLPYLTDTIQALLHGEARQIPRYDFKLGERVMRTDELRLGTDDLLILEGIHALNPDLLPSMESHQLFRVYVSALTTLSLDRHNRVSTSDNRLLRRLVRDIQYRGVTPEESIMRWDDVRAGEDRWIFPYQEHADAVFNSAILYELATLKPHCERALQSVREVSPAYPIAHRLLRLLQLFEPIESDQIPGTSLLREFLGGSAFKY